MTPDYEFATSDLTQHLYRFAKKDAQFLMKDPKPKPAPPAAPAGSTPTPAASGGSAPPTTSNPPASPAGA
jgi:hypothetical protein